MKTALAFLLLAVPALAQVPPTPAPFFAHEPASEGKPAIYRVTSLQWNDKFPIKKEQIIEAAKKAEKQTFRRFACEWTEGADKATCDFTYELPEDYCWYGYDHSYADLSLKDPTNAVVTKREWLAN
jgi:hypothetical protein